MTDYCNFSKNHRCLKWMDYQLTRYELEEADCLLHENQKQVQHLQLQVDALRNLLKENGVEVPLEEDLL